MLFTYMMCEWFKCVCEYIVFEGTSVYLSLCVQVHCV